MIKENIKMYWEKWTKTRIEYEHRNETKILNKYIFEREDKVYQTNSEPRITK